MMKTVLVLGASYAGARVAELLSKDLPAGWRLVAVDRQSHFNHVYMFPRFSVVPNHAHKAFIPYTNLLHESKGEIETSIPSELSEFYSSDPRATFSSSSSSSSSSSPKGCFSRLELDEDSTTPLSTPPDSPPVFLNALKNLKLDEDVEELDLSKRFHDLTINEMVWGEVQKIDEFASSVDIKLLAEEVHGKTRKIKYDYLVYALGGTMPPSIRNSALSKQTSLELFSQRQNQIASASSVLVVGGGAGGIQFSTDIKSFYPDKKVTIVHSRERFLPNFDKFLHDAAVERMEELGIEVIFNDRVIQPQSGWTTSGSLQTFKTLKGKEIVADHVIVCTGQAPNSSFISSTWPSSVNEKGYVRVKPTMQVFEKSGEEDRLVGDGRVFAIGDVVDVPGAVKAGYTGWNQAGFVAENILSLISSSSFPSSPELVEYKGDPAMIRVTLGVKNGASQLWNAQKGEMEWAKYDNPKVDGHCESLWARYRASTDDLFA